MDISYNISVMNTEIIEAICGDTSGVVDSTVANIRLFRLDKDMPRQPFWYGPSVILMCQGSKKSYIKERTIYFDNKSYLVVTGSIPLECEYQASENEPIMGIIVEIDPLVLHTVNAAIEKPDFREVIAEEELHIVAPTPRSCEMDDVFKRILDYLSSEEKAGLFVDDAIKELYYHLLKGEQAQSIRAMLRDGKYSRILTALDYIRRNFEQQITVETLAQLSHMSPTSFYRAFKEQTGDSPLQLIKKTRLSYAKSLLEKRHSSVKAIANLAGYESSSHFIRDFNKLYGCNPGELLK